jgi:phosphoglycerate dehydrogenase-like enzyme
MPTSFINNAGLRLTMPNAVLLLTLPQKVRDEYKNRILSVFQSVKLDAVEHVRDIDPYMPGADVLITFGPHLQDRADHVFAAAPKLKWIQALGTGIDNIIDRPALRRDVIVTNVHGIHGAAVSEAALMTMLSFARDMPRILRNQAAHAWDRFPGRTLDGKTVAIFGVGAIGEALAPRCKAMGMRVVGISSSRRVVAGFDAMHERADLAAAIADADYVVLLTPYSEATRHIVDARALAAMKPSAVLVNLARGGVVDEAALLTALRNGTIAGAALDVFSAEPLPADHPFWDMHNVLLTPHLGGFYDEYAAAALEVVAHNMRAFLAGEPGDMMNVAKR